MMCVMKKNKTVQGGQCWGSKRLANDLVWESLSVKTGFELRPEGSEKSRRYLGKSVPGRGTESAKVLS